MPTIQTSPDGTTVVGEGGGGASLPTAGGAGELLRSTGATDEYEAVPQEDVVGDGLATLYSPLNLGNFSVADGAGGTQPATDVPEWVRQKIGVQDAPRILPFFVYATIADVAPVVQGLVGFTPGDYEITYRSPTVLTLDAIGSVTGAGLTGTLEILNAAGTVVASIDWTETTPTRKTDAIALPAASEVYRARISCAGGVDPLTDYALIGGANLRITWS